MFVNGRSTVALHTAAAITRFGENRRSRRRRSRRSPSTSSLWLAHALPALPPYPGLCRRAKLIAGPAAAILPSSRRQTGNETRRPDRRGQAGAGAVNRSPVGRLRHEHVGPLCASRDLVLAHCGQHLLHGRDQPGRSARLVTLVARRGAGHSCTRFLANRVHCWSL